MVKKKSKEKKKYSNEYSSFIFTHIPKCGGTSFRHYINSACLLNNLDTSEIYIPGCNEIKSDKNLGQLDNKELEQLRKNNIRVLANHTKYEEHSKYKIKIPSPYYYTLLRNPIQRFISHYNFFYYKNGLDKLKNISLNDLEEHRLEKLIISLSNLQVSYLSNVKYPKAVGSLNQYKIAYYNLTQLYGGFGILEQMEESLKQLQNTIPSWLDLKDSSFPSLNAFSTEEKIKPSIIKLIKKHNDMDIRLYNKASRIFKERVTTNDL